MAPADDTMGARSHAWRVGAGSGVDSVGDAVGDTAGELAARYGTVSTRRGRYIGIAVAVAGGALALVVFGWTAIGLSQRDARWQDISYVVVDDHTVEVRFEVYAREGATVRCVVRAIDGDHADVGQVERDIGPIVGQGAGETVRIRTLRPAQGASVRTCVLLRDRVP